MKAVNSARYRKQAIAERKIPDGLASPAPMLPLISKVKWKAEREAEKEVKAEAEITLPKPGIIYSVSKGRDRKRKSKTQEAEASAFQTSVFYKGSKR